MTVATIKHHSTARKRTRIRSGSIRAESEPDAGQEEWDLPCNTLPPVHAVENGSDFHCNPAVARADEICEWAGMVCPLARLDPEAEFAESQRAWKRALRWSEGRRSYLHCPLLLQMSA